MSYQEFLNKLIFKEFKIEIPILNISINKIMFTYPYGYDVSKQDSYIKQLFLDNQEKLKIL